MSESDFFKFFVSVEICYLFLDTEEVIYEIEGEKILKMELYLILKLKKKVI